MRALFLIAIAGCVEQAGPPPPLQTSGGVSKTVFSGMSACLDGPLIDPVACSVSDVVALGTADETATVMRACSGAIGWPCWYTAPAQTCASGFAVAVVRTQSIATGAVTEAICASDVEQ
ncbi:MAG TPA: hypothetical protein VGG28_10165 [Kofleriaceae bacterium]|jgi:hypothetical protein